MTHGFEADGRLFMEVHDSPYLTLCIENWRTFTPGSIVAEYGRMRAAANGIEAGGFREKTGRLESFFRDEEAHRKLRKTLGDPLFTRLLEELREENYHMLAGGLMHEGLHAGLDDAYVARLQAEFKAGARPIQWDELRAFMAETGYHAHYCGWAAGEVEAGWGQVSALVRELEAYRRTAKLPAGTSKDRLERIKTQAWVQAALIRLRAREIWQSARRMDDLAGGFRKDYVNKDVPADLETMLARLESGATEFVGATEIAIRSTELALRALEAVLDTWSQWAAGRRPFPPPVTDSQAVIRRAGDIRWPAADRNAAAALMRRADREIGKDRTAS
jgi:hypothetical protein